MAWTNYDKSTQYLCVTCWKTTVGYVCNCLEEKTEAILDSLKSKDNREDPTALGRELRYQ